MHQRREQGVPRSRQAVPQDVPAERVLRGRGDAGLRLREDRRGGGRQGGDRSEEGLDLRPRPHVQHPRVRVPAEVDGVGRARGADAVPRGFDEGPGARRGLEQGRGLVAQEPVEVEAPDPLPAVVGAEAICSSR